MLQELIAFGLVAVAGGWLLLQALRSVLPQLDPSRKLMRALVRRGFGRQVKVLLPQAAGASCGGCPVVGVTGKSGCH